LTVKKQGVMKLEKVKYKMYMDYSIWSGEREIILSGSK